MRLGLGNEDDSDMLNYVNRPVELMKTEYIPPPEDSNREEKRQQLDLTDVCSKIPSRCPTSHIVPKISVELLQNKLRQKLCTEVPKNASDVPKISVKLLQRKLRQKLCTKVPTNASVIQEFINDTLSSKTKGSPSIASSTTSSSTISSNSNVVAQSGPVTASVPFGITNSNSACTSSVFLTPPREEYDSPVTSSELVNSKNKSPRKKLDLNPDTGEVTEEKKASPAAESKAITKRKRKRKRKCQDFALLLALSLAGPRGK